jgi:hypothetical protein
MKYEDYRQHRAAIEHYAGLLAARRKKRGKSYHDRYAKRLKTLDAWIVELTKKKPFGGQRAQTEG